MIEDNSKLVGIRNIRTMEIEDCVICKGHLGDAYFALSVASPNWEHNREVYLCNKCKEFLGDWLQ